MLPYLMDNKTCVVAKVCCSVRILSTPPPVVACPFDDIFRGGFSTLNAGCLFGFTPTLSCRPHSRFSRRRAVTADNLPRRLNDEASFSSVWICVFSGLKFFFTVAKRQTDPHCSHRCYCFLVLKIRFIYQTFRKLVCSFKFLGVHEMTS